MAQTKTGWETFDFNQDQVQEQIMSTLRTLFQNISLQLTNPFLKSIHDFPSSQWSQETMSEMRNLTISLIPESFVRASEDPSFQYAFGETVVFLSLFLQYYLTTLSLLSGTWILNRISFRSDITANISETLFCLILAIPIIPFALSLFAFLAIIRFAIYLYLKAFHRGNVTLLSPMDAFWAYEAYASSSCSVGLYIVEGPYDPVKIRQRIKESVCSELVGRKMHSELVSFFGYPCWKPVDPFRIEDYVKVALDKQGRINTEDDLFELCRSVQDEPIVGRAPWEVFIVPNFQYKSKVAAKKETENPSCYAVIFRIHHSLMDGISTANVLHSCMADTPFKFSVDPIKPLGNQNPTFLTILFLHFLGILSMPRVGLRNLILQDNFSNKYYLPGPLLTGPKTFTWTRPMKLDALKRIKNATKTSVFAVLLTALGGAYRTLCFENGKVPEPFIHSMAPVALLPYPDRKPKNRFTGILVPILTGGKEMSQVDRLIVNHRTVNKLWSSFGNINAIANWYCPIILGMMPLVMHKILSRSVHLKGSLSNIPGPAEEVMIFGGGRILDIGVWVPIKMCVGK
jgi:hypothetical protein